MGNMKRRSGRETIDSANGKVATWRELIEPNE
jgi:hypothetical protein